VPGEGGKQGWNSPHDDLASYASNIDRLDSDSAYMMSLSVDGRAIRSRRQAPTDTDTTNAQLTYATLGKSLNRAVATGGISVYIPSQNQSLKVILCTNFSR